MNSATEPPKSEISQPLTPRPRLFWGLLILFFAWMAFVWGMWLTR